MEFIKFNYPTEALALIVEAFCVSYNYDPGTNDNPNPISPNSFAKQKIIDYISDIVKSYQIAKAKEAASNIATQQTSKLVDSILSQVSVESSID